MKSHLTSAAVLWLALASSLAQENKLGTNCVVSFATIEAARKILTNRDDFIAALSPFDRSARLKTDRAVTEQEFLAFAGRSVLAWSPEETKRLTAVLQTLQQRLAPWNLPLPPAIMLIKTSGMEEGNANYTRQNAIVLAQSELRGSTRTLEDLVTHELFHVLSRHDADLRKKLYRLIGFNPINEIEYPNELRPRKITNPDGVQSGWAINVTNRNQTLTTVPILYASTARYNPDQGGEFFNYLVFKLLAVTKSGERWQPKLEDGKPLLLEPQDAQGFIAQVGRNTDYLIHPDEILAENFVHLVRNKTNLTTPRIVEEMKRVLLQRTTP